MQSDPEDSTITTPTPTQSLPASTPTRPQRMINLSDSDSDSDLDNENGDQSYLAGLNVPERLKNILRYKDIGGSGGNNGDEDNSDSDDDGDLFMIPTALKTPDRSTTTATTPKAAATPTITTNSTVRLAPIEKETPRSDQQNRFEQLLALALGDSTDDDTDNDGKGKKKRQTKKATKGSAKPTTKKSTSSKKKKAPTKKKPSKGKKATNTKPDDEDEDDRSDGGASSDMDSNSDSSTSPVNKRKGKSTKGTKKKDGISLALLEDTDDSDSDDQGPRRSKQLSRKARLEMERETQRLRRAAHIKLQPRMVRKTMEDLIKKLQDEEDGESETRADDLEEVQPYQTTTAHQSSPTRGTLYDKYKKELDRLERFNDDNMDGAGSSGDDDDGLIIVNTETRGTRFLKTLMSAMSPESPNKTKRSWNKSPSSPLALRTLNQQLMSKMGQEQQAYRQQGIEKAKALGLYVTPEDRAKQYLEREQEAAVLDLEVQKLLYRKAAQQNQRHGSDDDDDDDDDYTPGNETMNDHGGLVLSGDEDDEHEDSDQAGDDSDDDGPVFFKRRNKLVQKQKNPFLLEDSEDDDQAKPRQQIAPKAPEPVNSIANFFKGNRLDEDDLITESPDGPRSLTRLMQRSTLVEDDSEGMNTDGLDDDQQQAVEEEEQEEDDPPTIALGNDNEQPSIFSTPVPRKPKEQNDYVEEEAEEEDDEFFGLGGPDVAESADLDQFEDDGMLVQDNNETVDSAELRAEYQKNMLESDQHMVERLIKDITGGGLRRKRAAAAAGLLLDDYDLFDDDEETDDLVALRMSLANKRKKTMKGDPMTHLAADPKTAAFARAAMPVPEPLDLSGDEMDDDDGGDDDADQGGDDDVVVYGSNDAMVDLDDSEDNEEESIKVSINMVVGDYTEPWTRRSDGSTIV